MPRLITCPHCSTLIKSAERRCPFCEGELRATLTGVGRAAGTLAMGLALAGCGDDETSVGDTVSEAAYGVFTTGEWTSGPDTVSATDSQTSTSTGEGTETTTSTTGSATETETETAAETETDGSSGTETGTGTGTGTDTDTGSTVGEPDYGVPETDGV